LPLRFFEYSLVNQLQIETVENVKPVQHGRRLKNQDGLSEEDADHKPRGGECHVFVMHKTGDGALHCEAQEWKEEGSKIELTQY
jgi:hypothetical protein